MFFVGYIQLAIQLRSFRNIAIRQPTEFQLRLSVSHYDEFQGTVWAEAIHIYPCSLVPGVKRKDTYDEYSTSRIEGNAYRSKHLAIRYMDELNYLNELVTFRIKINAYPLAKLSQPIVSLHFELEQPKYTFLSQNIYSIKNTIKIRLLPYQNVQSFFYSFLYGCCIESTAYAFLSGYHFHDNKQEIRKIMEKTVQEEKTSHIRKSSQIHLPLHFQSLEEFVRFATSYYNKDELQTFYDQYVGGLRESLLSLRRLLADYLRTLPNREYVSILNMNVIRKLSSSLPQPTHLLKKQKKSIFDNTRRSLIGNERSQIGNETRVSEIRASTRSSAILYTSNDNIVQVDSLIRSVSQSKISCIRLSPTSIFYCITYDWRQLESCIKYLWSDLLSIVSLYPNPVFYQNTVDQYRQYEREHYLNTNCCISSYFKDVVRMEPEKEVRPYLPTIFTFDSQAYQSKLLSVTSNKKIQQHVVILVHGYQAYSLDMEKIMNYLKISHPRLIVHASGANYGANKESLETMGQKLAVEVKNIILSMKNKVSLSFICHSMGGIILRAALPYLSHYRYSMVNLITICSPHLGYIYHTSALVKTGLWFINKMQKSECLRELCCDDVDDVTQKICYLERLSTMPGIYWFHNVVLLGSKEDYYVNYHSSRIEVDPQAAKDRRSPYSQVYFRMLDNIQEKLAHCNTIKICIEFEKPEPSFNSFIGRSAHIQILTDALSIRAMVSILGCLF